MIKTLMKKIYVNSTTGFYDKRKAYKKSIIFLSELFNI